MLNYTRDEAAALSSSLSAANPDATAWPVDILQVSGTSSSSTPTPTPSSSNLVSSANSTADSSPTGTASSTEPPATTTIVVKSSSFNGLPSVGGFVGLLVGVVGGAALLVAGGVYLLRRKRARKDGPKELDANPYADNPMYVGSPHVQEKYAHEAAHEAPGAPIPPVEMPGSPVAELPGHMPHEGAKVGK